MTVEAPRKGDARAIATLVRHFHEQRLVLERSEDEISESIGHFLVAREKRHGRKILCGCVSLHPYRGGLYEIRSLAVDEKFQGHGIGRVLVSCIVELARERGARGCFALTKEAGFFRHCGFSVISKEKLPEKIWKDCRLCWNRDRCDETAMIMNFES